MASSSSAVQQGPRKVALVVGIQNYEEMPELKLTLNDAKLVAQTLQNLGFFVTLKLDLTNRELRNELSNFSEEVVKEQDLVYFYFAGHAGQQWSKTNLDNFLFGKDAKKDESNKIVGVSFKYHLLDAFYKKCIYVIILDACRVNPPKNQQYGLRSSGEGAIEQLTVDPQLTLVMPELPNTEEYEVIFGCQPGKPVIEDAHHMHGYLARALCDGLNSASRWDDVRQHMIKQVREETGNRQIPKVETGLTQTLYIKQVQLEAPSSDTSSNVVAPQLPVFQKSQVLQETPAASTSTNVSAPQLPVVQKKKDLQVLNLLQFCEQLKSKGRVENAEINVSDVALYSSKGPYPLNLEIDEDFFKINFTTIQKQQIFLKNIIFIQHELGNDKKRNIKFEIGSGRQLFVSNCSFNAIGLLVEGTSNSQNNSASLSDINVSNTKDHGLFFYHIYSVTLNRIQIKNCKRNGFYSLDVENVVVENAKISQCDEYGMYVQYTKNFYGQFIEVESCRKRGFCFYECKGELKNIKIRGCSGDILTNNSKIKQTDVCTL